MSPSSYAQTAHLNSITLFGVVLSTLIISNPSTAQADDFRMGIFAGGSSANNEGNSESANITFGGSLATLTNTYEVDKKFGFLAGANAGIKTENGFIFEGEVAYRQSDFDAPGTLTVDLAGETQSLSAIGEGSVSGFSLMANSWYEFLNHGSEGVRPFVGGGIGVVLKKSSGELRSQGTLFGSSINNSTGLGNNQESGFAWQAGAGLRVDVSDHLAASLSYRYFDGGNISGEFNFTMHSIVLSVSF